MSVRKRAWTTSKGERKEAWIVDYADQDGERHIQTFNRKKEADEYHATVSVDIRQGIHTPHSKSVTVAAAAEDWIKSVELDNRERSTIEYYRNHVDRHINPSIGQEKLAKLTTPRIQTFRDDLLTDLFTPAGAQRCSQALNRFCAMPSAGATWPRTSRWTCRSRTTNVTRQN